jgi:hypothetical protein
MIVYPCFKGDGDMALAWVQHDLYFACPEWKPWLAIGGSSTLGWIWGYAVHRCSARRHAIPWIDRNFERIQRIDRFSHKLLQVPHEHIAAYFRWIMPRVDRKHVYTDDQDKYPTDLLESWKVFLQEDIPGLLASDEALVALARSMVYQAFDVGDEAYHDFQDALMRRYGFACVTETYWAADVAARALPLGPSPAPSSSTERSTHVQKQG